MGKKLKSGNAPFIKQDGIAVVNSVIRNRALVGSPLKVVGPIERVHVNSLNQLIKEFGPNGEVVWEPDNGDKRIRFVGAWEAQFSSNGTFIRTSAVGDFVELRFYGTGLNLLNYYDAGFNNSLSASIDGGAYGSNFLPSGIATILNSRNYKMNAVIPVVSGLLEDWHTIRIKLDNAATDIVILFGFEFLNESEDLTVLAGSAFSNGYEYTIENDVVIPTKTDFDNIIDANVGTKGGKAIVYIDPSSATIKKRLTKVDATSQFLASANHENEKITRVINWREFGRNRNDDFSTLTSSTSNRGFTLDDGATTLTGRNVFAGGALSGVLCNSLDAFITLTFEGTGLDVSWFSGSGSGAMDVSEVFVDGVSQGFLSQSNPTVNILRTERVCSGLAYGTHTVKINTSVDSGDRYFVDFTLFNTKIPMLPEGAVVLGEYDILSDFLVETVGGVSNISKGVVRKMGTREVLYKGTFVSITADPVSFHGGFNARSVSGGSSYEFSFLGNGVVYNTFFSNSSTYNTTITINGSSDLSSFTTSFNPFSTSGLTFNPATGTITGLTSGSGHGSIGISGLPFGFYTIKVTLNNNAANYSDSFDIITPIASSHTTFGNRSVKDLRNFLNNKSVNKIAENVEILVNVNTSASQIRKTIGVSQILFRVSGSVYIYFEESFTDVEYNVVTGVEGNWHSLTDSDTKRHKVTIAAASSAHSRTNVTHLTGRFTGVLEKDKLEEE